MPLTPGGRAGRDALCLGVLVAIAGLVALRLGQDANYDLLNYHLYNPWAWLTGRYGFDLAPAQLQTFHNPLLDVPLYLMVDRGWRPQVITVVLAVPAGVGAYALLRLARLLFTGLDRRVALVATGSAAVIGVTGPNAVPMLGTTLNEWPGAALMAIAAALLARDMVAGRIRSPVLLAAGLLAGAASGLKLTAATYALGMAVALLLTQGLRRGPAAALLFSVGVAAGLALTLGPWMLVLHDLTGNPFFPYLTPLFPSAWLPEHWTLWKGFGPKTAVQWVTLPFDLLAPPVMYVSEMKYRDLRFPLVAALALVAGMAVLAARLARRPLATNAFAAVPRARKALCFGAVWFAVSFAIWAHLHAIHRYLLALEVLTGLAIVALLLVVTPARLRIAAMVATTLLVVATTQLPTWGRVPFGREFLTVEAPPLPEGALVAVVGGPMGYVLPMLRPDARYVSVFSNIMPVGWDWGLRREAQRLVDAHRGPFVSLSIHGEDAGPALASFGLAKSGSCDTIRSNLTTQTIDECALVRIAGR